MSSGWILKSGQIFKYKYKYCKKLFVSPPPPLVHVIHFLEFIQRAFLNIV
jgi:hypothetical protein